MHFPNVPQKSQHNQQIFTKQSIPQNPMRSASKEKRIAVKSAANQPTLPNQMVIHSTESEIQAELHDWVTNNDRNIQKQFVLFFRLTITKHTKAHSTALVALHEEWGGTREREKIVNRNSIRNYRFSMKNRLVAFTKALSTKHAMHDARCCTHSVHTGPATIDCCTAHIAYHKMAIVPTKLVVTRKKIASK